MHVFECLEQLVHDVLLVDAFKDVGTYNCMQVGFHKLKCQVYILVILSLHDIEQPAGVKRGACGGFPPMGWKQDERCLCWCTNLHHHILQYDACAPSTNYNKRATYLMMFSWPPSSCKNIISRKVRCVGDVCAYTYDTQITQTPTPMHHHNAAHTTKQPTICTPHTDPPEHPWRFGRHQRSSSERPLHGSFYQGLSIQYRMPVWGYVAWATMCAYQSYTPPWPIAHPFAKLCLHFISL